MGLAAQAPELLSLTLRSYKIFIQHSRTNTRKFCFSNRVAPWWNKLPEFIKNVSNINEFKNRIDEQNFMRETLYEFDE